MSNNAEIIQQWKDAEAIARTNANSSRQQINILGNQVDALERNKTTLIQQKKQLQISNLSTESVDQQISELDKKIEPIYTQLELVEEQERQYQAEANNAKNQYTLAERAPDGTVNTTAPAEESLTDDTQSLEIQGEKLKTPEVLPVDDSADNFVPDEPAPTETIYEQPPTPEMEPIYEQPPTPEMEPIYEQPPTPEPNQIIPVTAGRPKETDLRFRISIAETANYFYRIAEQGDILYPLKATNGVIFPYTPQINVTYTANYDSFDLTHVNYKPHTYRNSSVENVTITGIFTAQDSTEAQYVLAVMHFFKSATKMFYGQDSNPKAGTPPPLCFLHGFGQYAFNNHPVVISSFTLNYPDDVNYISTEINGLQTELPQYNKPVIDTSSRLDRLLKSGLKPSGLPNSTRSASPTGVVKAVQTYVPSKIQISITATPMISRNAMSNNFSLKNYATGALLNSRQTKKPGVW
jgi:hypothetical protein